MPTSPSSYLAPRRTIRNTGPDLLEDEIATQGFEEGPMSLSPVDALATFTGGRSVSPEVELWGLQTDRQRELRDRISNAAVAPQPGEIDRLKGFLGRLEADMAPTQTAINANRAAQLQGFAGSGDMAEFGRELETQKVLSPLAVEQARQSGALGVAQESTARQRLLNEANIAKQQEIERTKREAQALIQGAMGTGGLQPGARVSTSGTGGLSYSAPSRPNLNPLYGKLSTPPNAQGDVPDAAILERGIISQLGLNPEVEELIYEVLDDPAYQGMDPADIADEYDLASIGLSPDEFISILGSIRPTAPPPEPTGLEYLLKLFGVQGDAPLRRPQQ